MKTICIPLALALLLTACTGGGPAPKQDLPPVTEAERQETRRILFLAMVKEEGCYMNASTTRSATLSSSIAS